MKSAVTRLGWTVNGDPDDPVVRPPSEPSRMSGSQRFMMLAAASVCIAFFVAVFFLGIR